MHTFKVDQEYNKWFCYITYFWQDENNPEFRPTVFGPFTSKEDAESWGESFVEETWSYIERKFK